MFALGSGEWMKEERGGPRRTAVEAAIEGGI